MRRVYEYIGPKHPEHDSIVERVRRVGQVWEDDDGWIFFVVGDPVCTAWEENGLPIRFRHGTLTMDERGDIVEWPLEETVDRPLEVTHHMRLA